MPRQFALHSLLSGFALSAAFVVAPTALADEVPRLGAILNHDHAPVRVHSKPVIERLPVKVVEPVDLVVSGKSRIFVADRKAECVFRLDERGSVSFAIEHLTGIQRIQVDADGSLYVLASSGGESSLRQITESGKHVVLQTFSFPASAFVRDELGRFVLSVKQSGRLVSLDAEGEVKDLAQLNQVVQDLILNAGGQLEALLPSGHIVRIDEQGEVSQSGFAEPGSTRLASLGDGTLLSLADSGSGRSRVVKVSREVDRPAELAVTATVPVGTMAVGFDSLGNLCLANPDLRAVTRVTSHFEIACPHCGKPTRMIFTSEPQPGAADSVRSF
ncbi:MAG: hypothetical protein U0936_07825 [Planctomycetaceae bacterium]